MQEHPVPQNITSYEFHLVGNMTLKQFFELAAGAVLAFAVYSTNLPQIFKFILIPLCVGLGAAVAFVPFEERPLDQWIIAFIRAIYNPTKFYWKKMAKVPDFFSFTRGVIPSTAFQPQQPQQYKAQRAQAYIQSLGFTGSTAQQDEFSERISSITELYASVPAANITPQPTQSIESTEELFVEKPDLTIKTHSLRAPVTPIFGTITVSEIIPPPQPTRRQEVVLPTSLPTQNLMQSTGPVQLPEQKGEPIIIETMQPDITGEISLPIQTQSPYHMQQITLQTEEKQEMTQVQTNTALPFPKPPTQPNVLVGMVLDTAGKIVENAIIEIRESNGFPARALRTNKLGQFFTSTPLKPGNYEIVAEKDGVTFQPMGITLTNTVVPPLEIRATT